MPFLRRNRQIATNKCVAAPRYMKCPYPASWILNQQFCNKRHSPRWSAGLLALDSLPRGIMIDAVRTLVCSITHRCLSNYDQGHSKGCWQDSTAGDTSTRQGWIYREESSPRWTIDLTVKNMLTCATRHGLAARLGYDVNVGGACNEGGAIG